MNFLVIQKLGSKAKLYREAKYIPEKGNDLAVFGARSVVFSVISPVSKLDISLACYSTDFAPESLPELDAIVYVI